VARLAVIGGTGALALVPGDHLVRTTVDTPYGPPSGPLLHWRAGENDCYFLSRHGLEGTVAPHCVNYRANLWAIHEVEPDWVLGLNAVGGIHRDARPGQLVIPDQIIDYSWGREHTFEEHRNRPVTHVDFTVPFCAPLRDRLLRLARTVGINLMDRGCYGVTQGPRLETAAEIDRLERDGCDVVGMTAMPEAGLARELELNYAICAVVVNYAAGRGPGDEGIHAQIDASLERGMAAAGQLLHRLLQGR
jgi:5'-methylthioinosine phosphorylase